MPPPIQWADNPPVPKRRAFARIATPRDVKGFHCVILSPGICGVFTHFIDGRTQPCNGPDCWCAREGRTARWKGYLPIVRFPGAVVELLELTEGGAQQLAGQVVAAQALRGIALHVKRRTNKDRSPMDVQIVENKWTGNLPSAFDPVPVLLNLWGIRVRFETHLPGQSAQASAPQAEECEEP